MAGQWLLRDITVRAEIKHMIRCLKLDEVFAHLLFIVLSSFLLSFFFWCRVIIKNDEIEMSAHTLGLTMESNGVKILEPFDTSVKYSSVSGTTNIELSVSNIFMNFSFSILRLFIAVEEDILSFLSMTSRKMTVVCTEFDKVGIIRSMSNYC